MSDAADNHGSLNSDNATAPGTELETGRPLVDPRFIVEHLPQILTGLGFVIYAAVRISYQAFYGSFNLTPEAVGITYLSIVAPAAIVTCVIVLAVGLVFGPFLLLRELPNGPDEKQAARPVKRSYIGPLIILLALAVLSMFFVDADTVFEFVFLGGSSLVVFGELALIEIAERRRRPEDAPKPRYVLFPAPFWIIIAGIAMAFILTASHNLGDLWSRTAKVW